MWVSWTFFDNATLLLVSYTYTPKISIWPSIPSKPMPETYCIIQLRVFDSRSNKQYLLTRYSLTLKYRPEEAFPTFLAITWLSSLNRRHDDYALDWWHFVLLAMSKWYPYFLQSFFLSHFMTENGPSTALALPYERRRLPASRTARHLLSTRTPSTSSLRMCNPSPFRL